MSSVLLKNKVLVCCESKCGGETVAVKKITAEMKNNFKQDWRLEESVPLTNFGLVVFFVWLIWGIKHWIATKVW